MKYHYKCLAGPHEFDVEMTLKEVANAAKLPKVVCPKCGGASRRIITGVAVHYKGKGFYSTDNTKETKHE